MKDGFDSGLELGVFFELTKVLVKLGKGNIIGEPDTVGLYKFGYAEKGRLP